MVAAVDGKAHHLLRDDAPRLSGAGNLDGAAQGIPARSTDLQPTLRRYAKLFDLGDIGDKIGYPLFMKPYDGGAWVGVTAIKDREALLTAYETAARA